MTRFHPFLIAACLGVSFAAPAAALDCAGQDKPFSCLKNHAESELKRMSLTPNKDQEKSFRALDAFDLYLSEGPEAAVKAWEEKELPVYDLILTLLLADQVEDAQTVAEKATKPFGAFDANNKGVTGKAGFEQVKKDLKSYYHGEEDMVYARACVSDEAFKKEVGGSPRMRKGACHAPHDPRSVQRAFGMMQLLRGVSTTDAVDAAMQYAYRVPSCTVATAVLDVTPTSKSISDDASTAAWKVLDMATVCAAELLIGMEL